MCICFLSYLLLKHKHMDRGYFNTAGWASLCDHLFSALTSASPDFPVQYFRGRKEVVVTTLTWFGGQNHFLPIAYLVTSSLILLIAVVLTVLWWKFGKNGKNMVEWGECPEQEAAERWFLWLCWRAEIWSDEKIDGSKWRWRRMFSKWTLM